MHLELRGRVVFVNGTRDEGLENRILYFFLYINVQNLNSSLFILVYQTAFLLPCGFFWPLKIMRVF